MLDTPQEQEQNSDDLGATLQKALGLTGMITQIQSSVEGAITSKGFKSTMKEVLASTEIKKAVEAGCVGALGGDALPLIIATVEDSVVEGVLNLIKKSTADEKARAGLDSAVTGMCQNSSVQGVVSNGVYHGFKRLLADGEVQKNLASIGSLVFADARMTAALNQVANTVTSSVRQMLLGKEFRELLDGVGISIVADAKDAIGCSISEAAENIKKMKVSLSGSLE